MKVLILGIGQSLRGDDAAGLRAVNFWQSSYPDSAACVHVELSESPGLSLLGLLEGFDSVIMVDAVKASYPPGTVIRLSPEELLNFTPDALSAHGWGVAETLQLGLTLYPYLEQCRITLIGIVGKDYGMGLDLCPEVSLALEKAAKLVEEELQKLLKEK